MTEFNKDQQAIFEAYIIDEVNILMEKHKRQMLEDFKEHQKKIQGMLTPIVAQNEDIYLKTAKRTEEIELERKIQIRTQNACILLTAGILDTLEGAVAAVLEIENLFAGK